MPCKSISSASSTMVNSPSICAGSEAARFISKFFRISIRDSRMALSSPWKRIFLARNRRRYPENTRAAVTGAVAILVLRSCLEKMRRHRQAGSRVAVRPLKFQSFLRPSQDDDLPIAKIRRKNGSNVSGKSATAPASRIVAAAPSVYRSLGRSSLVIYRVNL